jgi:molybdopterin-guanine dinucleotide biosynthesis protein A
VKRYSQIEVFILAGGVSSRMGRSKGLLEFGGVPLIVHTARLLEPLVASVTIVGSPERYMALGLKAIADEKFGMQTEEEENQGPLVGIATALNAALAPWILVVACDLPYLSREWVDWLLSRTIRSQAQIIAPRTAHGFEPLAAVYRRECLEPIRDALARGVRKVTDAWTQLSVEAVIPSEWSARDQDGIVLRNMNAPEDYEGARKWWDAKLKGKL